MKAQEFVTEKWSQKYKNSINCSHPKGFSQRAHCAGKKKHNEDVTMEQVCPDCGMCQTHGNLNEIKKGQKDANGYTRCWPGKHAEGTKRGKNGGLVRNCVPNESVEEALSRKDLLKQVGDKLNDPEFRKQPADPNIRWEKGDLYKGPGPDDYGYTGYQGHGMPRDKPKKKKGVAEGHADQQRKVFKKNGEPVGEVGIDRESSPGVGQYYMKHYASGNDLAGYDSYEEAVAELKHCMKQGVAEGEGRVDPILIKALNRMPDGLATHREVLDAAYDAYAMELGKMAMRSEYGVTNRYIPQLLNLYKDRHGLTFNEDQDLLKNTYTVVFVDPNTGPKVLGKFNSVAEAKKLIRNSFDDMYDTGDHLRNVAPGIYVLEEDYRNTGERATANNYKHFYHWIIQPSQGVKEDTELAEEFDLIELIIEDLAASNGVDSEVI